MENVDEVPDDPCENENFVDHPQHSDHPINISEPIVDSRQTSPSFRHSTNLTSSPNDRNSRHISKSESSPECGPMSADSFGESQTAINLDLETNRPSVVATSTRSAFLPWGIQTRTSMAAAAGLIDMQSLTDGNLRPGEIVMRTLFADFTKQAEKKIEGVMLEPSDKNLSKLLQRGEDPQFDQLLCAFGTVAEHCLPSLLLTLLAWHKRQLSDNEIKVDLKRMEKMATKSNVDLELQLQRRESAVEFIFCLALIEILKQLQFHPGHEDIIKNFENLAFKHFKYRDGLQTNPNAHNIHMIADLYAEVTGVLAHSRFSSVRKRFMSELKELRLKEASPHTTQSIISLLMGMKFFRIKMVPIEEFEASFQFMHECAQYFLEVKDKDIKHALAGLFVEILVPVAAAVKNEVNVPCVKNFVDLLYAQTLDACAKSKHRLALFPLVTCLLCVSQKTFFLNNWHYFLAMCLSNLKNRDSKMSRVALESLYRLLWVYMIRIKCESNSATQSRLQSIVNSLFPKGSKAVVPRDTPLNIFVKIIQFIAQERLDFAMREIVFELLCVGRPIKIIMTPERMSIGLRAFLVVADSLQQKDGEPPMPRTVGVLPSGNTLRVKKTYINKMLTNDTARSIGLSSYFPHVRRVFVDILRALDVHYGRPLMLTNMQNLNKEPDEMLTGERKPRIDLFRTCVAAVPRLVPDTMTMHELVDMLSRLTVHMDEELRTLAHQSLQTLVVDFPDWRQEIIQGYTQFLVRDVIDTFPQLVDGGTRLLLVFINIWRSALANNPPQSAILKSQTTATSTMDSGITPNIPTQPSSTINSNSSGTSSINSSGISSITQATTVHVPEIPKKNEQPLATTMHYVQGFALVMLCNCRSYPRKLAVNILKEVKNLIKALGLPETEPPLIDVIDKCCPQVLEKCLPMLPQAEKVAMLNANVIDLQWITDRTSGIWTTSHMDDSTKSSTSTLNLFQTSGQSCDPWAVCLFGFMERSRVLRQCPAVVTQAWPICYHRVTTLFNIIDPTPVSDNRASLLRAPPKKTPSEAQRDALSKLWRNQVAMIMRLVPQIPSVAIRCASPDLSLSMHDNSDSRSLSDSLDNIPSNVFGPEGIVTRFTLPLSYGRKDARQKRVGSSPDSLTADRSDKSSAAAASPVALYKLIVPLLRCEVADVRDAAVNALGLINHDALKDLMDELVIYIREAVDRKQENMRRRRRRDALRLQLVKVLENIAANCTFGISSCVIERETMALHPILCEYIEGARLYLETETDKDNTSIREVKKHFCDFIRIMIKSFSLESCATLLSRDLKSNLFNLFASWGLPFTKPLGIGSYHAGGTNNSVEEGKLQFGALMAMSALLCCGPCFDPHYLSEEGIIYPWLDLMLTSTQDNIYELARDTVVLLLESNPDIGQLLEWVIDRCYTAAPREADACFLALAAIFSAREYPCDHYTSVINVTLLMTGCPRVGVHSTAIQLLQVLDKRFFGTVGPLHAEGEKGNVKSKDNDECHVVQNCDVDRSCFIDKIMNHYLRHNLSLICLEDLMKLLNDNRETCDRFPTSKDTILKMFGEQRDLFHMFNFIKCEKCHCMNKVCSDVTISSCTRCNTALKTTETNFFVVIPIEQQIRKSVKDNWSHICEFEASYNKNNQSYSDARDGKILKDINEQYAESDINILSLCLNLDGANKYKSNTLSVWPIQLIQNYLPPNIRFLPHNIIVSGLYYHQKKPDCYEYMLPLINELNELSQRKITLNIGGEEFVFKPIITHCSVDLPAKSLLQATKQFGGYESCTYCDIVGELIVLTNSNRCNDGKTGKKKKNIKENTNKPKKPKKFVRYTERDEPCALRDEVQTLQTMLAVSTSTAGESINGVKVEDKVETTLDAVLSDAYCRSHMFLSKQMAKLRPELTMPMFSEITHRFQTARADVRALLLQCLLPWLENMELVAASVPPPTPLSYITYPESVARGRREGCGSTEATEMILNNLFYITTKFADLHPREVEELWGVLCRCWPNNLKVILRYLVILAGMAPNELLPYAKRVALYMARTCPDRLIDELMNELQTVETLNCLIERTETPPFYRLTSMRKASSHSDGPATGVNDSRLQDLTVEKGTIHTKRHSGEDPIKTGTCKSDSGLRSINSNFRPPRGSDKIRASSGPTVFPRTEDMIRNESDQPDDSFELRTDPPLAPHPLPMPEYGGYFAPLTEYLPDISLPISGFHRCNVAVMLLTDIVVDGIPDLDWTLHIPLMLHILFVGLDHTRPIVRDHCKQLLINLLIALTEHNDHLTVARIILHSDTSKLDLGLTIPQLAVIVHNFTEPDQEFDSYLYGPASIVPNTIPGNGTNEFTEVPVIVTEENAAPQPGPAMPTAHVIKSLIRFLSQETGQPLWNYEDITAKVWTIKSADQLTCFLHHILKVYSDSYSNAKLTERWAQTALQLGLSCSSRHYAGRSLQVFRALNVPINSRMLSDILSRLVETVAEQGEDMQGYVTELLLTLEAAVDSLDSDFRPLDVMKDIFKSTPNLNNKDGANVSSGCKKSPSGIAPLAPSHMVSNKHARSTSYSVSYCTRKTSNSPIDKQVELRNRATAIELERNTTKFGPAALSRSRSAQSLKLLGDTATQDDKMTILAQLFWLAVSLLESDYEHEFLLACRLLTRVLHRLPLDRPDARDKVEKLQQQLKWIGYPGVHSLLLKGCTHSVTYEPTITLLSQLAPLLSLPVCDPTGTCAFPMNVIALLPYMLLHYEDANEVCIRSAENIAQVSSELGSKLENLGTVMTLYSRKTFSKESFQWTKCVVKYLHDTYAFMGLRMLAFLIEVLEKGMQQVQVPVLNVLHCMLHYIDLSSPQAQPISGDLLRVIAKYLDNSYWKEALKILKLVVTRSSSLQVVPQGTSGTSQNYHGSFSDSEVFCKKELAGRTMDFTFDVSQTPLIGRRILLKSDSSSNQNLNRGGQTIYLSHHGTPNSPRRSASLSPADAATLSGWKRPWMSQGRVRECLVNLLTTCGQRVGLPKSPSVIFSQSSDLMERQSSAASSTEETSGAQQDISGGSRRDDGQPDFGVFKDFDFLEYESESIEGESTDNFNWGVRRRPLSEGDSEPLTGSKGHSALEESLSEKTPILTKRRPRHNPEDSSDEDIESESPLDEYQKPIFSKSIYLGGPPNTLSIRERRQRRDSVSRSDTSGSSAGDLGDITPCNASPHLPGMISFRPPPIRDESEEIWRRNLQSLLVDQPTGHAPDLLFQLYKLIKDVTAKSISISKESMKYFTGAGILIGNRISVLSDLLSSKEEPPRIWYNQAIPTTPRLSETLRFGVLEIQEHLETYFDRKDHVLECLETIKSSTKLALFSDTESAHEGTSNLTTNPFDPTSSEVLIELGRSVYKLMFQLLLLIESNHKLAISVINTLQNNDRMEDLSMNYLAVRGALLRCIDDVDVESLDTSTSTEGEVTPTPSPGIPMSKSEYENVLIELIDGQKWSAAISHVRQHKKLSSMSSLNLLVGPSSLLGVTSTHEHTLGLTDDLSLILTCYSQRLIKDRIDVFISSRTEYDLIETQTILMENVYHVSGALTNMEMSLKGGNSQPVASKDIVDIITTL